VNDYWFHTAVDFKGSSPSNDSNYFASLTDADSGIENNPNADDPSAT
jgi:hypothetical protein